MNRRKFLQLTAAGAGGMILGQALKPSLLLAQSIAAGTGKNLVVVNLLGGMDGLTACPYYAGPISGIINSELRPSILVNPASVLAVSPQNGVSNKIGLHPAFQPLFDVAGSHIKIVQGYGIPGDPGRSHDTCQILMSLGATELQGGEAVGFMARLMDSQDWETLQYWALAATNAPDTNTQKRPPVTVGDLASFDFAHIGWEGAGDEELGLELSEMLLEVAVPRAELGTQYKDSQLAMRSTVSVVRNDIITQQVGNNSAGDYVGYGLGQNLRDAARVLKAKATSSSLNYQNKDMLLLCAQGGYDTHSDQANPDIPEYSLAGTLGELATNLAVFYRDLELMGQANNTIVVVYSEFGRTNYQNANEGMAGAGTDHGHGSNTIVFGGPVQAGVVGVAPTANELHDEYDALLPKVDFRDIFSDVFAWMGVSPATVFPDSNYHRTVLGIV